MSWKTIRKKWKKRLLNLELFPWLGAWLIRVLGLTVRKVWVGREKVDDLWSRGDAVIYVFWHGRLLMMPLICLGRRAVVMISQHGDGELISRIIRYFGYYSVRGSSSQHGVAALRELARELKRGSQAAIAPDGPRGPRQQAKSGAILLARLSGCPLVPVAFSACRGKFLSTWDRFFIPYPFARGVFIFGDPIWVGADEDRLAIEEKRKLLEARLNQITEQADRYFGD